MSQQVQELINKIKKEGTQAAEAKAHEIEETAKQKAHHIVNEAKNEADKIIEDAKKQAEKEKYSGQMALQQASRDVLISLRKEIDGVLQNIIKNEVKDSLSAENLANIIASIIDGEQKSSDVVVTLSEKDLKVLEDGFTAKLQKKVKEPITFQSSADVSGGFTVSYDGGKSSFEYTENALAEYIGRFLNENLKKNVKEAAA